MPDSAPVALLAATSYDLPALRPNIFKLLDACQIPVRPGMNVLVKPNLLMAHAPACTNPGVVACACEWLLAKGAKVTIADSPAFGTAVSVSNAIGLADALRPLGLEVSNFKKRRRLKLQLPGGSEINIGVAILALESDLILSVPRIKAHSQMRITLAVKNCYGCIPGVAKALNHCRWGQSVDYFADCVSALWRALPPVAALCDGIIAMSGTGPRNGKQFKLGLLAASSSAPAADAAIITILGISPESVPLCRALKHQGAGPGSFSWPLAKPEDLSISGFEVPAALKDISFNPFRLASSVIKRAWLNLCK